MPNNPYIAGNPVGNSNAFVGRSDVLDKVVQMLRRPQDNAIVLYGQRRIGKTSVLQYLKAHLPNDGNYCPIYFDLQDKASWTVGQVVSALAKSIANVLNQAEPDLGDAPETTFQETWLPNILQSLSAENRALVLLFDEFDVLAAPEAEQPAGKAFFPYLRQLLDSETQHLNFVFVIGRNVADLTNIALSVFKGTDTKHVSLLNQEYTQELVRLSEANHSLNWPDEAIDCVYRYTNGHPFLTQQLCSHVWEERAYDNSHETIPAATSTDVEEVIFETLDSSRNTLEWLWDGLPPAERVVASALAEAGPNPMTEEVLEKCLHESGVRVIIRELQNAPRLLQDWDLLEPADGGYRFRVELLRRWIEENKPLKRVQEELDRIEPVAENFYQAALGLYRGGQLETAINPLRQAIELNPNHVNANQLLADILLAQGQAEEARKLLERLYEYKPAAARSRLIQALLELANKADNDEQQLGFYEQVLELEPNQSEAAAGRLDIWQQRGDAALAKNDFETALKAYRKVELTDKVAEVEHKIRRREFSNALIKLEELKTEKRYQDALNLVRQLANEFSDLQDWRSELAQLEQQTQLAKLYQNALGALQSGDKNTATMLLAKVVGIEPDYEEATRYLHLAVTGVDVVNLAETLAKMKREQVNLEESLAKTKPQQVKLAETLAKTERKQRLEQDNCLGELKTAQQHYKKTYSRVILGLLSLLIILVILSLSSIKLESVISLLSDIVLLSDNLLSIAFGVAIALMPVFLVLGIWVLQWWNIYREDKARTVNLLIYDGMDDPGAVAAKKVPITGKRRVKLDGKIRLPTKEGKTMGAEYFRVKREPNPSAPQATVEYRWQGEEKTHILKLSGKLCKNIEGLPSDNYYLIILSY
jgi:tetratricopeptide (TPR) repeat protein